MISQLYVVEKISTEPSIATESAYSEIPTQRVSLCSWPEHAHHEGGCIPGYASVGCALFSIHCACESQPSQKSTGSSGRRGTHRVRPSGSQNTGLPHQSESMPSQICWDAIQLCYAYGRKQADCH